MSVRGRIVAFALAAGAAALLAVPVLSGEAGAGDAETSAALDRARAAAAALAGKLPARLQAEIAAGGTVSAIRVCSEIAQPMTAELSGPELSIRRVSLKVRNPADRPDDWERARLETFAAQHGRGELPAEHHEVVEGEGEGGRELRYLKPVLVGPVCLRCHGDAAQLEPEVARRLAELYPADEAVGYAEGDLRGAVSVRVALPAAGSPK